MPTTPGWVYVLVSSRPGVIKIGRSTRHAGVRAQELEQCEGYAEYGPFREVMSRPVADCSRVEAAAHRMLEHRRIKVGNAPARELFHVEVSEACRVVHAAASSLYGRPEQRRSYDRRTYSRRFWPAPRRYRRRGLTEVKALMFGVLALAVIALANGWIR